jgi:GTPase
MERQQQKLAIRIIRRRRSTATALWCSLWFVLGASAIVDAFVPSTTQHQSQLHKHTAGTTTSLQVMSPPDQGRRNSLLGDEYDVSPDTEKQSLSGFYDLDTDDEEADTDDESLTSIEGDIDYEEDSFLGMERNKADILEEREDRLYVDEFGIKRKVETCVLVGVEDLSNKRRNNNGIASHDENQLFTLDESMTEMRELIKTAGLELVGEITQRMNQINPRTYVGTGKVEEANAMLQELNCCTIVFDAELTPGQQKALENAFNKKVIQNDFLVQEGEIKVIDRTALILDIFAQHAKTREGKLQVDLALHVYRKPRLTKMWTHLERQSGAGGVGLRGPGESQLEIDKRLLRDRIIVLKQKIDDVQKQRTMHRRGRERMGLPILSLVGYTNAGKSSLLNYLTRSGVLAESMLFATLDPTTRKVKLPGLKTHPEVLLTDTVGFIQKLPTHLVAAFRATLEEVKQADVLVHVIDISNPTWKKQEQAVNKVLADIGAADKPVVRVFNKIDLLNAVDAEYVRCEAAMTDLTVAVSALLGDGMQDFVAVVEEAMTDLLEPIEVIIPYSKGDELNSVHEQGNVEVVDYREQGTYVRALVPASVANRLAPFSVQKKPSAVRDTVKEAGGDIDWTALGRGRHSATKE